MTNKNFHIPKRILPAALAALAALLALALLPGTAATKSNSGLRGYQGKVASVSAADQTFEVRRKGKVYEFTVDQDTRYKRLTGFAGLEDGMRVKVRVARAADESGLRTARVIERKRSSSSDDRPGHDAGDDNGSGGNGADDGPGHDVGDDKGSGGQGADDGPLHDAGDDKGSGGHGADDGPGHDVDDDHGGHHGGHGSDD